jgi:hypothetical protein
VSEAALLLCNKVEEAVALDYGALCVDVPESTLSPIDEYYGHVTELVVRAGRPENANDHVLLGLLLLELVSAAELYFRQVLASLPGICPLVRAHCDTQMIPFGAMSYYTKDWRVLGTMEHAGLSGKGEIAKATRNIVGIDIKDNSSPGIALADFEKVCQLRHAVVHARGRLWFRNLNELGLRAEQPQRVQLEVLGFQALVAKTHNAVRAYNRFVVNAVVQGWIARNILKGKWVSDKRRFSLLHGLFYSRVDGAGESAPRQAYEPVRKALLSR